MDVLLPSSHAVLLVQLGSPAVSRLAVGSWKCHGKNDSKHAQLDQSLELKKQEIELLFMAGLLPYSELLILLLFKSLLEWNNLLPIIIID